MTSIEAVPAHPVTPDAGHPQPSHPGLENHGQPALPVPENHNVPPKHSSPVEQPHPMENGKSPKGKEENNLSEATSTLTEQTIPTQHWTLDPHNLHGALVQTTKNLSHEIHGFKTPKTIFGRTVLSPLTAAFTGWSTTKGLASPFVAAGAVFGLTPLISGIKRALFGERAIDIYNKTVLRKNPSKWESITRGAESKMVKNVILKPNKNTQELLAFVDKETGEINKDMLKAYQATAGHTRSLIEEGVHNGMKIAAIEQHMQMKGADWSDQDKIAARYLQKSAEVAHVLFQHTDNLTKNEKDEFVRPYSNSVNLEHALKRHEFKDWAKQVWGITKVGMLKAFGLTTLGEFFRTNTVQSVIKNVTKGISDFTIGIIPWVGQFALYMKSKLIGAATAISNWRPHIPISPPTPGYFGYVENNVVNALRSFFYTPPLTP